jgi:hypothetical protein
MQGGREDLTAAEIAAKQKASGLIPELNYQANGMSYALKGIENIDGVDCYVLYTNDGLAENYDYFSTQTFLKLRAMNIRKMGEETVETTTNYADYKEVDGFKFAHSFSMTVGQMTLTGVVKTLTVNPKLAITEDF